MKSSLIWEGALARYLKWGFYMRKLTSLISSIAFMTSVPLLAVELTYDCTSEIPEINVPEAQGFQKIDNVAQYKNADWSNVVGIARNITINEAYRIADAHPEVAFFFHTKGYQMVLEKEDGGYRVFRHGDTVFFKGSPWWGSAPQLADGYIKKSPGS